MNNQVYDYVIVGSGFGGSVAALRLAEKGYQVLVLERGKAYTNSDFPKTNWNLRKFLWLPALRSFGIMGINLFKDILILNGSGVGGGSLVYAGVMLRPEKSFYEAETWRELANWEAELAPFYDLAEKMMGVSCSPRLGRADFLCQEIASELGREHTFRPVPVAVFFGEPGQTVPDPYFGGAGPVRAGCTFCGNCMVGCRTNGKNTLDKNYLYLAQQYGAKIRPEAQVTRIQPSSSTTDQARYEVFYNQPTAIFKGADQRIKARNVVVAAGVLGTLDLLIHCRDRIRSLPALSHQLGQTVRSNGEALLGVTARNPEDDFSQGVAIASSFWIDDTTSVEPVRYGPGSSFMRNTALPLNGYQGNAHQRMGQLLRHIGRQPGDFLKAHLLPHWSESTTIFLVMQTVENRIHFRPGRGILGSRMVTERDEQYPIPAVVEASRPVLQRFANRIDGFPQAMFNEVILNTPSTAHILGGCSIGKDANHGVVDVNLEVFNYPGLYVVDASVIPANLGVNPSLTILALAERAMHLIPAKKGGIHPMVTVPFQTKSPVDPAGKVSLPCVNPATGQQFGRVLTATTEEILSAREEMGQAFQMWRRLPVRKRARFVKKFKAMLIDNLDEITMIISQDVGKSRQDALVECLMTIDKLHLYSKNAPRWLKRERVPPGLYPFKRYYTTPHPYGVVAVLSPWNFPFDLCVPAVCAALLAGNTVLLKPSEFSPATGALIADLFRRVPELSPFVRVLLGDKSIGEAVVAARPDLIFLTGSRETGKAMMRAAVDHMIPVLGELGGKDPLIVLEDADISAAARWGAWGAYVNAGQTCMGIERAYVVSSIYDRFLSEVLAQTRAILMGYDSDINSPYHIGPIAHAAQLELIEAHLQDAVDKGAQILVGGQHQGLYMEPTVLVDVNHDMRLMQEETFGPILPIMRVDDESEAIRLANDSDYGLSASVWSQDLDRAQRVAEQLQVGSVNINDVIAHYAVSSLPYGGVKQSGNVRTHCQLEVTQFTHQFSVSVGGPPRSFDLATRMRQPGHYWLGKAIIHLAFGVGWRQRVRALSSRK